MTDLVALATGKLNDPILMDWAISRYRLMENHDPQHRDAMEQAWFDDLTLRRWLDSDNEDILTRFLNVNHPELDSVAERVQKAQTEQRTRLADFKPGEWFNQTLILELKCPECGDTNEYKVRQVAVNPGGKTADMLLVDEFPCASCGRWVDFEFTASANLAITAELLKMASDGGKEHAGQSRP